MFIWLQIVIAMILTVVSSLPTGPRSKEVIAIQPAIFPYLALAPDSFNLLEEIQKVKLEMQEQGTESVAAENNVHFDPWH